MSDDLNSMDRAQLEEMAENLGVKFNANIKDDTLRARIAETLGDTSQPATETDPAPAQLDTETEKQKRFEIIIQKDGQDKQPVPVGVNGRNHVIKRGEKVIVAESVVHALTNAVQHQYDPDNMEVMEVLSYPFTVLREVA